MQNKRIEEGTKEIDFRTTQGPRFTIKKEQKYNIVYFVVVILTGFFLEASALVTIIILLIDRQKGSQIQAIISKFQLTSFYKITFYGLISLKCLVISIYILERKSTNTAFIAKISSMYRAIHPYYKQLDYRLTQLLLLVNFRQNIIPYIFSIIIQVRDTVYVKNYIIRKYQSYIKCHKLFTEYRILRLVSTILYFVSCETKQRILFSFGVALIITMEMAWLLKSNYAVHRQAYLNRYIFAQVALHIVACSKMVENLISSSTVNMGSIAAPLCMLLVVFLFFESCRANYASYSSESFLKDKSRETIKNYSIDIFKFEEKDWGIQEQCSCAGILKMHWLQGCINCKVLSAKISNGSLLQNGQKLINSYIECLYQQFINEQIDESAKKQIIFDYCQHLLNGKSNINRLLIFVHLLSNMYLDAVQKQKLSTYKHQIKGMMDHLNLNLYSDELTFEPIQKCETTINQIQHNIRQYTRNYQATFYNLKKNNFSVSDYKLFIKVNILLMKSIDQEWSQIQSNIHKCLEWRNVFLTYAFFLKNKPSMEAQLKKIVSLTQQKLSVTKLAINNSGQEVSLRNPIFSDSNVGYFSAKKIGKQLQIQWTSKVFSKKTGYNYQKGTQIAFDMILPEDLRVRHQQSFLRWFQSAQISSQNAYRPVKSQILTQHEILLPVLKLFKTLYRIQEGLQFLCMINFIQDKGPTQSDYHTEATIYNSKKSLQIQMPKAVGMFVEPNIFIKQSQVAFSKKQSKQSSFMSLARIFGIFCICSLFVIRQIQQHFNIKILANREKCLNYATLSTYPTMMNTNIMRLYLGIGSAQSALYQINKYSSLMQSVASSSITLSTIFDPQLKSPEQFYGGTLSQEFMNISYNSMDLFDVITSLMVSFPQEAIDPSAFPYRMFTSYLKPAFVQLANFQFVNLHKQYLQIISDNKLALICTLAACVIITIASTIFMLKNLMAIKLKYKKMYEIITQLKEQHFRKIIDYVETIKVYFYRLTTTHADYDSSNGEQGQIQQEIQQDHEQLLNKLKGKNEFQVQGSNKWSIYFLYFSIVLFNLACISAICLANYLNLRQIETLETDGFSILKHFPSGLISAMGSIQKYGSQLYQDVFLFDQSNYEDIIASIQQFSQQPYKKIGEQSQFHIKVFQYFFNNPCKFNPSLLAALNVTVDYCEHISTGILRDGLSSYLRYSSHIASTYLRGRIELTSQQLDQYLIGSKILDYFILDALSSWTHQFKIQSNDQENLNDLIAICSTILMISLFILTAEWVLKRYLLGISQQIEYLYNYYIPTMVFEDDKIIRQKLISEGIINKSI